MTILKKYLTIQHDPIESFKYYNEYKPRDIIRKKSFKFYKDSINGSNFIGVVYADDELLAYEIVKRYFESYGVSFNASDITIASIIEETDDLILLDEY